MNNLKGFGKTKLSKKTKEKWYRDFRKWHNKNARAFPWRHKPNLYNLTVAEVLLQKTPASRIVKTYHLITTKYASFNELANAESSFLKKELQELGLQKRAVFLKNIASKVIKEYDGLLPSKKEDLLALRGIGPYTANAILCFGFNKRLAVVDSNVARVYKRIFGIPSIKEKPSTDKNLWKFANEMLPKRKFRQYNYALLDFAALVCKSKNPKCDICCAQKFCHHKLEGNSLKNI